MQGVRSFYVLNDNTITLKVQIEMYENYDQYCDLTRVKSDVFQKIKRDITKKKSKQCKCGGN